MSREEIQTLISTNQVEKLMLSIRGKNVLLDRDVAMLYGVETKRVNEAVRNNPDKFPFGYIFELDRYEKQQLVENFDRFNVLKQNTVAPTAFTERGLYMLATILKSPQAVSTTLADIVGNNLSTTSETEIELNFAVVKIKHKVIRKKAE